MLLWPEVHSTQLVKLPGYQFMWSHGDTVSVQSRFWDTSVWSVRCQYVMLPKAMVRDWSERNGSYTTFWPNKLFYLYENCIIGWLVHTCKHWWLVANSEGPATGHLDTGFSWFPCVYKQMLRWLPRFQVATTCFSCSPPDLNLVVTNFMFCLHVK